MLFSHFSVLLSILIKEMNDRMMLGPWFVFEERLHFLVGMSWTVFITSTGFEKSQLNL